MCVCKPRAWVNSFGLKPDDGFDVLRMRIVADGSEASREAIGIYFPCAGLGPVAVAEVPSGVHPPVVDSQPFLQVAVDELHLVSLVRVHHLACEVRTAAEQHRLNWLAARLGDVMGEHPAAEGVL